MAQCFFRQLELVPIAVDLCTEPVVKLDAALVPFCNPPLDHPAARFLGFSGDGFHKKFANTSAAVCSGDIEFLDDEVRLRPISEGNKIINQKSNQFAAFFGDKTMKIG